MLAPLAAVSGRTQDSHVAGLSVCTEPPAAVFSMFSKVVTYFLNGSSGATVLPELEVRALAGGSPDVDFLADTACCS